MVADAEKGVCPSTQVEKDTAIRDLMADYPYDRANPLDLLIKFRQIYKPDNTYADELPGIDLNVDVPPIDLSTDSDAGTESD